ncbi:MAG: hypothetical protein HY532_08740 [Chloroflexi bacterium]|nr:hypothetical protein [Chloroflexota bacterium]
MGKVLLAAITAGLLALATLGIAFAGPTENTGHVTIPVVAKDSDSPACTGTDADPCSGMGASFEGRTTANGAIPGP